MKLAKKLGVFSLAAIGALSLGFGINSHINQTSSIDYGTTEFAGETYTTKTYETSTGSTEIITIDGVDYLLPQITTTDNSLYLNTKYGLPVKTVNKTITVNGQTYYDVPVTIALTHQHDEDDNLEDYFSDSGVGSGGAVYDNSMLSVNIYVDMTDTTYTYTTNETGPKGNANTVKYEFELMLYYGLSENANQGDLSTINWSTMDYLYSQYVTDGTNKMLMWQVQMPTALWSYDFFIFNETEYSYNYAGGSNLTNYKIDESLKLVSKDTIYTGNYVNTLDYADVLPHFKIDKVTFDPNYNTMSFETTYYAGGYTLNDGTNTDSYWTLGANVVTFDYVHGKTLATEETGTESSYILQQSVTYDYELISSPQENTYKVTWDIDLTNALTTVIDPMNSSIALWNVSYDTTGDGNIRTDAMTLDISDNGVQSSGEITPYSIGYEDYNLKLQTSYLTPSTANSLGTTVWSLTEEEFFSTLYLAPVIENSIEPWIITTIIWGSAALGIVLVILGMNLWERHKKYGSMFSSKYSWMHAHHVNEKIILTNKDTGEVIEMERDL